MNEINMVSKAQQNKELEAKILELRKKEYTGNEIAAQLHIEQRRVARTIDILISKGLLGEEYKNLKKKETLQRKQQALNLIREGKTVKEIAETLGVVQDTIYVYIKEFIKNGEMEKEDLKKNLDLELENKVLELRKKEYSKQQIMEKLGIGQKTVVDIIQRLADEGKLPGTMLPVSQDKIAKKEQMKSDVQKLIGGGYTVAETARIIRVSESTVYNYIKELINEGKIDEREIFLKKQARLNELEQTIIELLRAGNNRKQIAKELNISYNELNPIINRLIVENKVGPVKVKGNNNSKSAENKLKNREGSNQVENMARLSEEALELI